MSARSSQLADKAQQQITELIEFLTSLADADLEAPCADDRGGSTVSAVASHIAMGYGQAAIFLKIKSGLVSPAAIGHGHNNHQHHDRAGSIGRQEMINQLKRDGSAVTSLVRDLTAEQLESIPPAAGSVADGHKTLGEVIEGTIDHQAAHLERLKKSVAEQKEPVREAP